MDFEILGLLGPVIFLTTNSVLERITPNYDWKRNFISQLSLGKYGKIQKLNFIICGLLGVILSFYLYNHTSDMLLKTGWIIGILPGISMILAGVWNTDIGLPKKNIYGKLHNFAYYLGVVGSILLIAIIGFAYRNYGFVLFFSLSIFIFTTILFLEGKRLNKKYPGIYQRLLLYSILIWIETISTWTLFYK